MGLPAYEKRALYEFIGILLEQHFTIADIEALIQRVDARMQGKESPIWRDKVGIESYVINVFERISGIGHKTQAAQDFKEGITQQREIELDVLVDNAVTHAYCRMRKRLPENLWTGHKDDLMQEARLRIKKARDGISETYNMQQTSTYLCKHAYGAMLDYVRNTLTNYSRSDYAKAKCNKGAISYMSKALVKLDIAEYADILVSKNNEIRDIESKDISDKLKGIIVDILSAKCKCQKEIDAFLLVFFDDMSFVDVADKLGLSQSTISMYISSMLSILKQHKQGLRDILIEACGGLDQNKCIVQHSLLDNPESRSAFSFDGGKI